MGTTSVGVGRRGSTEAEPGCSKVMEQREGSRKIPGPALTRGLDLLSKEQS